MDFGTIMYEKEENIGTITLNRPKSLNAISLKLIREATEALGNIARDNEVRIVIITGANENFSSGADIKEMPPEVTDPRRRVYLTEINDLFRKIEDFEKPVISAISGYCLGGALELAMSCDLRIASTTAKIGQPEIIFGGIPAGGGTIRLPLLVGIGKAKEMAYTGESISAEEAYRIGLVNKVVSPESLMSETRKLARLLVERSPSALRLIKFFINTGMRMDRVTAIEIAHQMGPLVGTPEEIAAAKEKVAMKSESYKKIFGASH